MHLILPFKDVPAVVTYNFVEGHLVFHDRHHIFSRTIQGLNIAANFLF